MESTRHEINPGDRGKMRPGWLAPSLWKHNRKIGFGGRIHRFHWRRSRAVQTREDGTHATRSDEKPLPVESSNAGRFRPARESQWPKGPTVITAHQHGTNDSGGLRQRGSAQRKTPKGGTKGAFETGRTQRLGRTRENLPQRRRCRKRHRWPVSET